MSNPNIKANRPATSGMLRDGDRFRVSINGGVQAHWGADGRELFFVTLAGHLMAVAIVRSEDGRSLRPGEAVPMFRPSLGAIQGTALHGYFVAPGGQRFLIDAVTEQQPAPHFTHPELVAVRRVVASP